MDPAFRADLDAVVSGDRDAENAAFESLMAATESSVDWAYAAWDEVVGLLRHPSNRVLLAGIRRRHTFGGASESIPAQWADFNRLGPIPGRTDGTAYGAMCATWLDEQAFEYLSGVEVDAFDALPPELGRMRVPAQRYAVFEHHGSSSDIQQTWGRIWQEWVPRSGLTPGDTPDFERYDARFDPATGEGVVEIWFPIQEREAVDAQD